MRTSSKMLINGFDKNGDIMMRHPTKDTAIVIRKIKVSEEIAQDDETFLVVDYDFIDRGTLSVDLVNKNIGEFINKAILESIEDRKA